MNKYYSILHRLIFCLCILLFSAELYGQKNSSASVKFVIGRVEVLAGGQTSWKSARMNQKIFSGDRISTKLNSRIEIGMPDGSVIKINENTTFDVKEIKTAEEDKDDSMSFTVWAGSIWAKFKKVVSSRQKRVIESPSAVVAVRGTTLDINVDQGQATKVRVYEGRVAVKSKTAGGEVLVGSNQQSTVEKGKAPTPAQSFTPDAGETKETAGGLVLNVEAGKLQYTDPAVLNAGVPVRGKVTPGSQLAANGKPLTVQPNGVFAGRVRVQEGINSIRFEAKKDTDNANQTLKLYVNTKRPQIRLSRPLTAGFTNRREYSLSGAVFDNTPKDKIKVFLNAEMVSEAVGQSTFNRTIILKEGINTIKLGAADLSGNRTERAEQIFLDTVKPIITVTEPAQQVKVRFEPPRPPSGNYSYADERFRQVVRGIIIDPAPSSGLKRIVVQGKEIKPNTDGSFETEIVLTRGVQGQPGANRITFFAEDLAGNITRDNSHVIYIR